jgi:hypothetical protein
MSAVFRPYAGDEGALGKESLFSKRVLEVAF